MVNLCKNADIIVLNSTNLTYTMGSNPLNYKFENLFNSTVPNCPFKFTVDFDEQLPLVVEQSIINLDLSINDFYTGIWYFNVTAN